MYVPHGRRKMQLSLKQKIQRTRETCGEEESKKIVGNTKAGSVVRCPQTKCTEKQLREPEIEGRKLACEE